METTHVTWGTCHQGQPTRSVYVAVMSGGILVTLRGKDVVEEETRHLIHDGTYR